MPKSLDRIMLEVMDLGHEGSSVVQLMQSYIDRNRNYEQFDQNTLKLWP